MNILLGVSGGIAAYKSAALTSLLKKEGMDVNVVMTEAATEFVRPLTFETLSSNPVAVNIFDIKRAWEVEHISLAKKVDLAVLAPATANTIAKIACGIADNMITTVFLALTCPVIIVPAMNTAMLENTATQVNLQILKDRGFYIMQPGEGMLACGDTGAGRMREPQEILAFVNEVAKKKTGLTGKKVLITAGPTCEAIDPVRYITNRSSGKMGYAIARAARDMGADVTVVSGPVSIKADSGICIVDVVSAQQMYEEMMLRCKNADIIIACAAVADYTPNDVAQQKMKKKDFLTIDLHKTKDILKSLGDRKKFHLVGFAAETQDILEYAKKKLEQKNLDMIVANDVSKKGMGFDSDFNAVTMIKRNGDIIKTQREEKSSIAMRIMQEIERDIDILAP